MKIRIIKDVSMRGAPSVKILSGATISLPDTMGEEWIKLGLARPINEKTVETAELPEPENALAPAAPKKSRARV